MLMSFSPLKQICLIVVYSQQVFWTTPVESLRNCASNFSTTLSTATSNNNAPAICCSKRPERGASPKRKNPSTPSTWSLLTWYQRRQSGHLIYTFLFYSLSGRNTEPLAFTQWPPQAQDPPLPGTHPAAESPFLIRILSHCHVFVSASVIVFTYVCKQVLINVKKWTSDPTDVDISSWVTHWEICIPPRPAAGRVLDHHC